MTRFSSLISAALAATSVVATASAANAAVTIRPTITVPVVHPSVPVVHPVVPTVHPVIAAPKPVMPSIHTTIALTHAAVLPVTRVSSLPTTHASGTKSPEFVLPGIATSEVTTTLNGQKVLKATYVNGDQTTVYYESEQTGQFIAAVSSITAPGAQVTHNPSQPVGPATPVTHPTTPAQQPAPSKPAASSATNVTFTPTSYPEIKGADDAPIGYQTPQGPVYFPNGQIPLGYSVGPNNTIETYIKS